MGSALDRLGGLVMDAALATTLWTGVCALAMVASAQPLRRCWVARWALVGSLLTLPIIAAWPGRSVVAWEGLARLLPGRTPVEPWMVPRDARLAATIPPSLQGFAAPVALLWLGGCVIGLTWVALGWWAGRRLIQSSQPARPATWERLRTLLRVSGTTPAPIHVAHRITRPVLVGWWRPVLVIPRWLDRPASRPQLTVILLHEMAHLRRRDAAFGFLGVLAQAVWFPLPPIWWIRTQMRLDQEFLADHDAASALGPCSNAYASSLLSLAGSVGAAPTDSPVSQRGIPGGKPGGLSSLALRVLMLVRCPFAVENRLPPGFRLLALPALGAWLLACSLTPVAMRAEPSPPESPHSVTIGRLVLGPNESTPGRLGFRFPLPVPPLASFDLTCDVLGPRAAFRGLSFGGVSFPDVPGSDEGTEPSHQIRLQRNGSSAIGWVDGQRAPVTPPADDAPIRIEVRSEGPTPLVLRNLQIRW